MTITLVVADDHPIVRGGIVALLAAEPGVEIVAEAADGHEAVAAVLEHRPSVVLTDLRMPGLDGVGAIEAIRAEWPAGALSLREIEVLRGVASGNTNAAIAAELHISQATVKTHLLHIYDKLGVSDRAAAVATAYENGVLS